MAEVFGHNLPSLLVQALNGIGGQIEVQTLVPLWFAQTEELAETFRRSFSRFRCYYMATAFIVRGFLREHPQRLTVLTLQGLRRAEGYVNGHWPNDTDEQPMRDILHGSATIRRLLEDSATSLGEVQPPQVEIERCRDFVIAFALAFSGVYVSVRKPERQPVFGPFENIPRLAQWGRGYAEKAVEIATELGVVKAQAS